MKLFLQKNAKFSSAGGSAPTPPCLRRLGALPPNPQPPAAGGFAPRPPLASGGWGLCPQTPKTAPPIANFWLRAWLGMSKILTSWIETLLRHRTVQVELYGDKVKREVVKGNPQGGILSPFMWNCVLNSLLLELHSRGFYVQAYADDLAVLVTGADMLWIKGMAQKAINIAANWDLEQALQFSSKKTEIVLFPLKRNPDLGFLSMNGLKLKLS